MERNNVDLFKNFILFLINILVFFHKIILMSNFSQDLTILLMVCLSKGIVSTSLYIFCESVKIVYLLYNIYSKR